MSLNIVYTLHRLGYYLLSLLSLLIIIFRYLGKLKTHTRDREKRIHISIFSFLVQITIQLLRHYINLERSLIMYLSVSQ